MIPDSERVHGSGQVTRDVNGKVYGHSGGSEGKWYELHLCSEQSQAVPSPQQRSSSLL